MKLCAARSGSETTKISAGCWTARTSTSGKPARERRRRSGALRSWSAATSASGWSALARSSSDDELEDALKKIPSSCFLAFSIMLIRSAAAAQDDFLGCVQAWLLEKPAAWADEDAPCLAAALMAQRPPCKRPREDALLKAERSRVSLPDNFCRRGRVPKSRVCMAPCQAGQSQTHACESSSLNQPMKQTLPLPDSHWISSKPSTVCPDVLHCTC